MSSLEAFGTLSSALDYPMFVVTAASGEERGGCLVGFASQCSIDPARFLVCLSRKNHTYRVATGAPISPCTCSAPISSRWPSSSAPRRATMSTSSTSAAGRRGRRVSRCSTTAPTASWGRVVDRVDAGDHVGFVLDVVEASASDLGPSDLSAGAPPRAWPPGLTPGPCRSRHEGQAGLSRAYSAQVTKV